MPKKVEHCVKKVKKQGKSSDSAWAICQSQYKKSRNSNKKHKTD